MKIIALRTLREYWEKHPESEQPLKVWYEKTLNAAPPEQVCNLLRNVFS